MRSYISYRQSYTHHPTNKPRLAANGFRDTATASTVDERRGLMWSGGLDDEDGEAVIEMDLLPPRWMDISDEVTELLADNAKKSATLDKMHAKHVLPGFDDDDVRRQEEGEIDRLTQHITRGFQACQRAIGKIDTMVREMNRQRPAGISRAEETMAHNVKIALASKVQESSASFRKKQSAYLKSTVILGESLS